MLLLQSTPGTLTSLNRKQPRVFCFRNTPFFDNALDREVGLVREAARKVVRAELALRDERFGDEELRPLVEELELCVIVGISGYDENTGVGRSRMS